MSEDELKPRDYQVELMQICLKQNSIIFLPTGSGKTFIAMLVLKQLSEPLAKSWADGGKRTIVLVNTVVLAQQHRKSFERHTTFRVGEYTGEQKLDFWSRDIWDKECSEHEILVMTCQVLANALSRNVLDLERINLLIFDECHRGVCDQPMRQVMMTFQHTIQSPRVIGLTATLLNGNCKLPQVMTKVEDLEITYHSKVATVDALSNIDVFSTNPDERIISYSCNSPWEIGCKVLRALDEMEVYVNCFHVPMIRKASEYPPLNPADHNGLKSLTNIIADIRFHFESLGVFGGYVCILIHLINLQCYLRACSIKELRYLIYGFHSLLSQCRNNMTKQMTGTNKENIYQYSSPKLLKLFELLKNNSSSLTDFAGIIFVQRRQSAQVIFHVLKKLAECDPDYSFIKPNFMIGYSANPNVGTREVLYLNKINRDIIVDFRAKKNNLLVATNVLEEGIDIPTCRLVVKFDAPEDYRAYIQSKGRARHKESTYVIMIDHLKEEKYRNKYETFKKIEETLNMYLVGKNETRDAPDNQRIEEMYNEQLLPSYYTRGPGSAYVSMVTASTLLSCYCNSFSGDIYTQFVPNWYIDTNHNKCRVIIEMPTVCPYTDPILGPFMYTKKNAKRAAALKACEILHQIGELDDSLKPKQRALLEVDVMFLFPHYNDENNTLAKKKEHLYQIKVPKCCKSPLSPKAQSYLHLISLTPHFTDKRDLTTTLATLYSSDLTYALVSSERFPNICNFPVYVSSGELTVELKTNYAEVVLDHWSIESLKKFTHFIYSDLLSVLKPYLIIDIEVGILLAPFNRSTKSINFEVISNEMYINNPTQMWPAEANSLDASSYDRRIVLPSYKQRTNNLKKVEYLVTRVCYEILPTSTFPSDKYYTYNEYYLAKYNYEIINQTQPLLEVKALSSRLDCTKPRSAHEKRDREADDLDLIHLIPEMVTKQDFPSDLWLQAKLLPTICDKIMQILRAEELRTKIVRGTGIGFTSSYNWSPLKLDRHLIKYEPNVFDDSDVPSDASFEEPVKFDPSTLLLKMSGEIEKNTIQREYPWESTEEPVDIERNLDVTIMEIQDYMTFVYKVIDNDYSITKTPSLKKYHGQLALTYHKDYIYNSIKILDTQLTAIGPELADIYKALAMNRANDIVNLERLETLGDSFLKLSTSLYINLKFPQFDEGKASSVKGKLVSNKNLFILGYQKQIGSYLQFFRCQPNEDWVPPGFTLPACISEILNHNTSLARIEVSKDEQISGKLDPKTIEELQGILLKESQDECEQKNSSVFLLARKQILKKKSVSDCCEAIIGAYLERCGIPGALKIVEWLGLFPRSENVTGLFESAPSDPVIKRGATRSDVLRHVPQYAALERSLGYTFRNRAYLVQAVTHPSYSVNRVTKSYQQLEFLGDAVLDFLITCYIYENCGQLTPGEITDLRSALVNNVTFASLAVRCGFHKHLLHLSQKLQKYIDRFVAFQENRNHLIDDVVLILLNEDDQHMAEYIDTPKVLGDLFESLAGAVFLDSGMNLKTVWEVFYRIMWKEIEKFSNDVPKNCIRKLHETCRTYPVFHKTIPIDKNKVEEGTVMVKLDFLIEGEKKRVHGFGGNRREAQQAAAKIALRLLGI